LRAPAITSIKRSVPAPDLRAPTGTPKHAVDKLHNETLQALAMPSLNAPDY
jgi:hypothetical protein